MSLPDFQLERFFAQHEFTAQHLLCSSDCEAMSVGELLAFEDGAVERFHQTWLGYTESLGHPALRQAISEIYEQAGREQVLVFTGAEEAIYLFMRGCVTEADHVIVHSPCYQSLFEVANQVAGSVDRWHAGPERNWRLDLNQLESLVQPNTKAIVVNTPHNPTGWLMSADDWSSLHAFADARGIVVFCDEVYRESEYDTRTCLRAGCDMSPNAVSLGVMSKTYGLAGLRIGWVATRNQDVYRRLQSMKDYTTICNSAPSEFLAELGLRHRQKLIERNVQLIQANLRRLDSVFERHADKVQWVRPQAGAIGFPQLFGMDVSEFCDQLLQQQGVLLAPGSMFNYSGNHFRLGFGRANMEQGIDHLDQFLTSI